MYGKIYPSMFTGSMFGQGFGTYAIMAYAISNARPDQGDTVELNPPYLSAVFGEPIKSVEKSISYLCSPDTGSRSPAHEGRRLLPTDQPFTYTVVNLSKYRNGHQDEIKREFWRKEKSKYRKKRTECPGHVPDIPGHVLHADADADADVHKGGCTMTNGFNKELEELSPTKRISLEKERERLDKRIQYLKTSEFRTPNQTQELKDGMDRLKKIDSALHIHL